MTESTSPRPHDKLNGVDFHWFVVRSLPHQERKLAELLCLHSVETKNILEVYCPTHTTVSVRGEGREEQRPLFTGFVFVLATQQAVATFLQRHYPGGTMLYERQCRSGAKPALLTVPEEQMRAFMDFNDNYADKVVVLERPYSDYAFNPKTGEPNEIVRVVDGPLKGREGYLTRFGRERRVVFHLKAFGPTGGFAVSIPNAWSLRVVRLHNAECHSHTDATAKERAIDLLLGIVEAGGCAAAPLPMLHRIIGYLQASSTLVGLGKALGRDGHGELSSRIAGLTTAEASQILNLMRYEHDHPGYVMAACANHVLRPFLTPTPGITLADGEKEATLSHDVFTEIIRKVDITEQVYYPSKDRSDSVTTTYYAHIGIMPAHNSLVVGASPSPHGGEPERGFHWGEPERGFHGGESERSFTLFVNWDAFLGHYFLTAGKANERLVGGTTVGSPIVHGTPNSPAKLLDSFRNFAPTLYKVLADEASEVKAIHGLKVGHATINAMAITSADIASAKEKLLATCLAICTEISTTAHLAVWRRYLRTVWLHK